MCASSKQTTYKCVRYGGTTGVRAFQLPEMYYVLWLLARARCRPASRENLTEQMEPPPVERYPHERRAWSHFAHYLHETTNHDGREGKMNGWRSDETPAKSAGS